MIENEPKVAVLGGGTGISNLLNGLKRYPLDITAIITVSDDGGSSRSFRDDMKMPPPGDVRKVILSLSEAEPILRKLLEYRFKESNELKGHPIGNILLVAMQEITGDFSSAIKYLSKVLNVKGTVLPASNTPLTLCAELMDGTVVVGESNIPKHNSNIKRVFFKDNNFVATTSAVQTILEADVVIIGPGSLYTSIISNIIIPEIKEALQKTKAKIIYIPNIMTQPGETNNYSVLDHVKAIENHAESKIIDTLILNDQFRLRKEVYYKYKEASANVITFSDDDVLKLIEADKKVYKESLVCYTKENKIRHNNKKLASTIFSIILDEIENDYEHTFI